MLYTKFFIFTFSGIPYAVISHNKMEEEIVRKVIYGRSCRTSRSEQNGCQRRHYHGPMNWRCPLFKNSSMKPLMASTPRQFRRKTIDNSECETTSQMKDSRKERRDPDGFPENNAPIKSQKTKHNCNLIKGITLLNRSTDKHTSVYRNICGESFDVTTVKNQTQNQMLSLDESLLEAVDLDSAVKDYWDCQNRNVNLEAQNGEHEDRCRSPDLFEGHFNIMNDTTIKSVSQESRTSSCNVTTQCSESQYVMGHPLNRNQQKHMVTSSSDKVDPHVEISSDRNEHFQITDAAWGSDSFFKDVISSVDKDIQILDSSPLSNMPLGEKIKRALISNVQKPVTPKPKTVQVNAGHVPQNSSSSMEKLSAFSEIGPFFGLPLKVKSLIRKIKGITNLYCKCYV
jgi:hypothetical protein